MFGVLSTIIPMRWVWYALAAAAISAALAAGYASFVAHERGIGDARAAARYESALKDQKVDAAHKLADALIDVAALERKLNDRKNTQEITDATNAKTVAALSSKLRDVVGPVGRLRDPYQETGCGGCRHDTAGEAAAATNNRAVDPPEAGGLFSEPATRLLERLTREAAEINLAYISCRADAYSVRGQDEPE